MNKSTQSIRWTDLVVIGVVIWLVWSTYPPDIMVRAITIGISLVLGGITFLSTSPQTLKQRPLNRDLADEKVPWIIYVMPPIATVIMNSLFERSTQRYIGFTVFLTFLWFILFHCLYRLHNSMKKKS